MVLTSYSLVGELARDGSIGASTSRRQREWAAETGLASQMEIDKAPGLLYK